MSINIMKNTSAISAIEVQSKNPEEPTQKRSCNIKNLPNKNMRMIFFFARLRTIHSLTDGL